MIELPTLAKAFLQPAAFQAEGYRLLPLRFIRFDDSRYLVTNLTGEYLMIDREDLQRLVRHELAPDSSLYADLKAKHLLYDDVSDAALELLAVKYRSRLSRLPQLTALHIFVVTLRCDHSCPYCQVSRVSSDREAFDMTPETADASVDLMFRSPSRLLTVEFQGGESLLNFAMIKRIVERTENKNDGRDIQFVIATNLSPLTDEMLHYCKDHHIRISTSLDGPANVHNANRPRPGMDSHQRAVDGIARARAALGEFAVAALMTTTQRSLNYPREIIDEYVRLGFRSIFLRPLSPFGFAVKSAPKIGYGSDRFLDFYRTGLAYIISLNKRGIHIREDFSSIVLRKMLTPYASGYVNLQSPTGLGLGVLVYNYDGDVYISDEGRMLAQVGDTTFRLGSVHNSWEEIMLDSPLVDIALNSMTETVPQCHDCAFEPWCGTDPVWQYATQGDIVGHRPSSEWCKRNMGVFQTLVEIMESDPQAKSIMERWAN